MTRNSRSPSRRLLFLLFAGLGVLLLLAFGVIVAIFYLIQRPTIAVGSAQAYAAVTACDHPYFPLREGANWQYQGDIAVGQENHLKVRENWLVERVSGNQINATAVVIVDSRYHITTHSIVETIIYTCTQDGIFRDSSIVVARDRNIHHYTNHSGVYLPAPDRLVAGQTWDYHYDITTNFSPPGTDYNWTYEAKAVESIDSHAGVFDAIRVDGSQVQLQAAGSYTATEWFAYGVGQVRSERLQQADGVDISSIMVLTAYRLPD